jgi:hypothetical protein
LIRRQKTNGGIFFFQIFINDSRLVDHAVAVNQHRDLRVGIQFEKVFRFVFKIHFNELVGEFFF